MFGRHCIVQAGAMRRLRETLEFVFMNSASVPNEAIRNREPMNGVHPFDTPTAMADHVARHYRAIALPALAAATLRISEMRKAGRNSAAQPAMSARFP